MLPNIGVLTLPLELQKYALCRLILLSLSSSPLILILLSLSSYPYPILYYAYPYPLILSLSSYAYPLILLSLFSYPYPNLSFCSFSPIFCIFGPGPIAISPLSSAVANAAGHVCCRISCFGILKTLCFVTLLEKSLY